MKSLQLYNIQDFEKQFRTLTKGFSWQIKGFIDENNYIYPIGNDSKAISSGFERLVEPIILELGLKKNYNIEISNQTTYPDFTLSKFNSHGLLLHRIAIEIKSTYIERRKNSDKYKKTRLTLGSHSSYLKNNTKNIFYPYKTYHDHWIIGFVYKRKVNVNQRELKTLKIKNVNPSYTVKSIFLREKVDITGIKQGSGNTKNIGSPPISNPEEFEFMQGPFTKFRKKIEAFELFWQNYEQYKKEITTESQLLTHPDFKKFI